MPMGKIRVQLDSGQLVRLLLHMEAVWYQDRQVVEIKQGPYGYVVCLSDFYGIGEPVYNVSNPYQLLAQLLQTIEEVGVETHEADAFELDTFFVSVKERLDPTETRKWLDFLLLGVERRKKSREAAILEAAKVR